MGLRGPHDAVFYACGTAPAEFLELFASRRALIYVLEILAQVLALVTLAGRLPQRWLAFIDNVALAAFWSTAALREWLPDFRRVPSKANVSDAVSRGDLSVAVGSGRTRVRTPTESILKVLARVSPTSCLRAWRPPAS